MAVTSHWYGVPIFRQLIGTRLWDWDTDTIKCSLHTSAYTPNQDTHETWNSATAELGASGGYTAGGQTLTGTGGAGTTYDTATNEIRLDAVDAAWTSATFTCRYAVVYKDTGNSTTSPLIAYVDFGADETVSAGTFTIQWDVTGVAKITAA